MFRHILTISVLGICMVCLWVGVVLAQTQKAVVANTGPPLLSNAQLVSTPPVAPATQPSSRSLQPANNSVAPPQLPNALASPPTALQAPNVPPPPAPAAPGVPAPPLPASAGVPTPPPPPAPGVQPPPPPPVPPALPKGIARTPMPVGFLQNAVRAVDSARAARQFLVAGKVWTTRAPGGDVVLKASVLYRGVVVCVLRFNPADGALLPEGYTPRIYSQTTPAINKIKQELSGIISSLTVLDGAEFREPGTCWVVPLALHGMIVSYIRVYYDGVHIVPDFLADQEMHMYTR